MTVRIPITRDRHLTLISVYAPTMTSTNDDKAAFYTQLDCTIHAAPANDKLVVLRDFNARLPERQKTTWRHPHSKHWHTLDYLLTRPRDRGDVRITRSMPGADDCWMDHRLLISRLSVTILRPPRRALDSVAHQRFDCSKLRNPQVPQNYKEACERHLADPADPVGQATVEHHWTTLRNAMARAAEETLGYTTKKRHDSFDENDATISLLIETKRQACLTLENQPTADNKCAHMVAEANCQRGIRDAQNTWWQRKAAEIQTPTSKKDVENRIREAHSAFVRLNCCTDNDHQNNGVQGSSPLHAPRGGHHHPPPPPPDRTHA
ncbi:uncharacterized protein [Palaemon carinicauda]|uniref:uncharacterized protein n=1 Tax=Palaemon carinicauda TaxID=392227 RepID=UPI0035B5F662